MVSQAGQYFWLSPDEISKILGFVPAGVGDITSAVITAALGYTPLQLSDITSTVITNALGFAPATTGAISAAIAALSVNPQIYTPTSGASLTLNTSTLSTIHLVQPASALAALTVSLANGTKDGQLAVVTFGKAITLVNWGGTNIAVAIPILSTILTVPSALAFCWSSATGQWNRWL